MFCRHFLIRSKFRSLLFPKNITYSTVLDNVGAGSSLLLAIHFISVSSDSRFWNEQFLNNSFARNGTWWDAGSFFTSNHPKDVSSPWTTRWRLSIYSNTSISTKPVVTQVFKAIFVCKLIISQIWWCNFLGKSLTELADTTCTLIDCH